jgi:xylan 1,4-beta-xylosidase
MNQARDTSYVGPALANTIRQCDGAVDMMSFWTFSDVFEEGGPISRPFEGHFGLRAKGGINKPSYYVFALLHKLGDTRLANTSEDVIVTRRDDGTLAVAVWNLVDPDKTGSTKRVRLTFKTVPQNASARISRVDREHGNTLAAYKMIGSPQYPTRDQIRRMNAQTQLPAPAEQRLNGDSLELSLEPNALVLLELPGAKF